MQRSREQDAKRGYDAIAADATTACLNATFTTQFQQPGALPAGVTVDGVTFAEQPLAAGEEAVSYVATVTLKGTQTGVTAPIGVRIDVIRAASAVSLVATIAKPGA